MQGGIQKGIKQGKIEIAKSKLSEPFDVKQLIPKVLKLSKQTI
jgi:hypothetical protein